MIRKIAWNTFKNTGDINTFLELKQIENIENRLRLRFKVFYKMLNVCFQHYLVVVVKIVFKVLILMVLI